MTKSTAYMNDDLANYINLVNKEERKPFPTTFPKDLENE